MAGFGRFFPRGGAAVLAAFVALLLLIGGCGPPQRKIGVIIPLTGIRKSFGESMKKGIDMALQNLNAGKQPKDQLQVVYVDDQGDETKAREAAKHFAESKEMLALVGSYSNLCTIAIAEEAEKGKIPLISPTSASEEISMRGYKWVFRMNAPASYYAVTVLDFLKNCTHTRSLAVLYENDDFGVRTSEHIRKYASDMKFEIKQSSGFENQSLTFEPLLREVKAKKPEAIVMIAHKEDGLNLMRTARKVELNPRVFAGCGAGFSLSEFLSEGKGDVEYVFTVTQWNRLVEWPGAGDFVKTFRSRYGVYPEYHSAETYATMQVLAKCMEGGDTLTRDGLRTRLLALDADTVFGKIRFEHFESYTNQNSHPLLIQQVQKGEFMLVWPASFSKAPLLFPMPPWDQREALR
ncbi:MAG: ABC transporter substrate-binding protein [Candidatus Eremiobacteraeota bacterium]|nr:ABC transporter substrate-binding protein [Candidatus Eremiobacteraeota bacterium]